MFLSKSQYIRGVQCIKSLWLLKHKPELREEANASQVSRFMQGDSVGELALELFKCKCKIGFDEGDFNYKINRTKELLEQGESVIAEATFVYNNILVMVDILQVSKSGLIINEVKSSTGLKDVYLHDIALQYYVLSNVGYNVVEANLVHINKEYERVGGLELDKLFCKLPLLESVLEMQDEIEENLQRFKKALATNEPKVDIGAHCSNPYDCDFMGLCWEKIPPSDSVFNLANYKKKFELYKSGVILLDDIKDLSKFSPSQAIQIQASKNKSIYINKQEIKSFLATLSYPIYHLDFESMQEAVPSFSYQKPYMQVPFQYSLHIEHEDFTLEHREFLAQSDIDQRELLIKSLIKEIPKGACILAYNASFESRILKELARIFPKYEEHLLDYANNIKDLMTPFRNRAYYHFAMNGSYSIKAVLPAMIPQMQEAYHNLAVVHNGAEAMEAYIAMRNLPKDDIERIREALLEYCKLDTLAMVKILDKLRELVEA